MQSHSKERVRCRKRQKNAPLRNCCIYHTGNKISPLKSSYNIQGLIIIAEILIIKNEIFASSTVSVCHYIILVKSVLSTCTHFDQFN